MKIFFPLIVLVLLLFSSCIIEEPFDNTFLNDRYRVIFSESIKQVAFDNPPIGSTGFYHDPDKAQYIYFSDFIDTISNQRLYFKHEREMQQIVASYVDSFYFDNGMHKYRIEWDADQSGHVFGSTKYNHSGSRVSSEKYNIQYFHDSIPEDNTWIYYSLICRILEKKKFNSRGELLETLAYNYFDDGTYEIETTKGKEQRNY